MTRAHRIPFNQPVWLGTEPERLAEAIRDNAWVSAGGPFGNRVERILSDWLGRTALLTSSGTHALEMSALLLDVKPGDEIVLPSFTFVSTANAFVLRGASLRFVDVDANGNLDLAAVERALGPRTRAVVAVHYAGNSADLDGLLAMLGTVPLIEDAAQALGAKFRGRPLGTFGELAALSFHETKNLGAGEGGALLVARPELRSRALVLRDKGTDRQRFLRGEVDRYTWVDLGSSYGLSDLNAAYLFEQLGSRERIFQRRRQLCATYEAALGPDVTRIGGDLVRPHPDNTPNHHSFALVLPSAELRDRFIAHMAEAGIVTPFHYVALHLSPMGRRHPPPEPLPMSERLSSCLVRLPLFYNLSDADQGEVIERALEFLRGV
ncbi:MAG: dTDP-4-amino-4,6-dideoxygalactose transaminase [Polyangiaceae bacterium]